MILNNEWRAHARGLKIYGATLTPFEGAVASVTAEEEAKRSALNEWIRTSKEYDDVIDLDAAVRDPITRRNSSSSTNETTTCIRATRPIGRWRMRSTFHCSA